MDCRLPSGLACSFVLLGACVPDTAGPPAASKPALSANAARGAATSDGGAIAQSDLLESGAPGARGARGTVPEGPAGWRSVPREQSGFYAVLDGICSQLDATRIGKDLVVHYGGGGNTIYNNGMRRGGASFIALRDDGLEYIGDPGITSPTGVAGGSIDDFWIADSTGSRSSEGAIIHRHVDGGWKKYAKDQTNLHAWTDGGTIGSLGMAANNGELWVEGSTTKPPLALYADMPFPALSAFPSGDVLIVAHKHLESLAPGPMLLRHWAPGQKIAQHPLDGLLAKDTGWVRLTEVAPNEVYIGADDRILRWDGSAVRALARPKGAAKITLVRRAAPDDLWVLNDAFVLQRIDATTATPIATPEPIVDLDGVGGAQPWVVGKSGKAYRREGEAWKLVPMPPAAFDAAGNSVVKAKRVVVVAPDDVLVTAMYWEKGPGWKDQELHTSLLRTKPVKETLRCNEPDPESNNVNLGRGFQSWPPIATTECKTPFAVLARRSNVVKANDDWPRIRTALKGHPELGEVSLVDFVSGDRTFVGAKAADLDTAQKLVALVAKSDRQRPEIVCGAPSPTRTLTIDLTTGAPTAK